MTHGDKAKAKTGKGSSQTSGKKVSKAVEAKAGGKDQSSKAAGSKQQAGSEKAAAPKKGIAPAAKDVSSAGTDKAKARTAPQPGESSGFTNAVVGSAFKHALKKYPNAFRRLTD